MASQGYSAKSSYANMSLHLDLSSQTNVPSNQSTVYWSLYFQVDTPGNYSFNSGNRVLTKINDDIKKNVSNVGTINIKGYAAGTRVALDSGSVVIDHKGDGTQSIPVYGLFQQTQNGITWEISAIFTLDTIPRASTVSLSAEELVLNSDTTSVNINIERQANSFIHRIVLSFDNGINIALKPSELDTDKPWCETSTPWAPGKSIAQYFPGYDEIGVTIVCETYPNADEGWENKKIGTSTAYLKLKVPANDSSFNPSCDFDVSDAANFVSTYGGYIQNKSKFRISVKNIDAKYSTVKAVVVEADGNTYYSTGDQLVFETNEIRTPGENGETPIKVTIVNSRNRSYSITKKCKIFSYAPPAIPTLTAIRVASTNSTTEDPNGTYMFISANAVISSLGGKNKKSFKLEYSPEGVNTWTQIGGVYTTTYDYAPKVHKEAMADLFYNIKLTAVDNFTAVERIINLGAVLTTFEIYKTGRGFSFGNIATREGVLETCWPIYLTDETTNNEEVRLTKEGLYFSNGASYLKNGIKNLTSALTPRYSGLRMAGNLQTCKINNDKQVTLNVSMFVPSGSSAVSTDRILFTVPNDAVPANTVILTAVVDGKMEPCFIYPGDTNGTNKGTVWIFPEEGRTIAKELNIFGTYYLD